jgi:hypothetical protein
VKRLIVLLVLLAGGLAVAALAIPTNAAVVNGTTISQQQLNSDVSAIAASADYQCYLNSQQYLESNGQSALPPVTGAGTGQDGSTNLTATTAFVATYLDTEVGDTIILQLGAEHHVTVTQDDLTTARQNFESHISGVMQEVAQTAQGENAKFSCGLTGTTLSGAEVLATMPVSFVNQQVQVYATATVLQEDLAGVGASDADLQRYFSKHQSDFDTACFTVGVYSTEQAAQEAAAAVAYGQSFSTLAAGTTGGGPQGCDVLFGVSSQLGSDAHLDTLAVNAISQPISYNGSYLLVQITKLTPNDFDKVTSYVQAAVQEAGSTATSKAIQAKERRSDVSVDPRYGEWSSGVAQIFTPFSPERSDVPNAPANSVGLATSAANPFGG